jgi:hypothetical protein
MPGISQSVITTSGRTTWKRALAATVDRLEEALAPTCAALRAALAP